MQCVFTGFFGQHGRSHQFLSQYNCFRRRLKHEEIIQNQKSLSCGYWISSAGFIQNGIGYAQFVILTATLPPIVCALLMPGNNHIATGTSC